jgi:hypothetical protein
MTFEASTTQVVSLLMRRASLLILVAAALLAAPATASAKAHVVRCDGHTYGLLDPSAFPGIGKLRAIGLPRRTDGYAPPCLVAEAVAAKVQVKWRRGMKQPTTVTVRGARWNGGRWRVTAKIRQPSGKTPYAAVTARHVGASEQRVTFRGFS